MNVELPPARVKTSTPRRGLLQTNLEKVVFGDLGVVGIFAIVLLLTLIIVGPTFFGGYNLFSAMRQFAFVGIVAIGELVVLIIGGIDLSVGGVVSVSGILFAWVMANTPSPSSIAAIVAIVAGIVIGLVNGLLIAKIRINPFVVTLGMMQILFSASMIITEGKPITKIPAEIAALGQGSIGGIVPYPALLLFFLVAIMQVVLRYHKWGRKLYALGNSEKSVRLCGIRADRVKIAAYVTSASLASLGGIASTARLNSGQPTLGQSWELQAIAAVVIGGGSLAGGTGTAIGALIGIAILGIVQQDIVLAYVSPFVQSIVTGLVVIAAVLLDQLRAKLRK